MALIEATFAAEAAMGGSKIFTSIFLAKNR